MIYLNNKIITPTLFPDNTSQVWHIPEELLNLTHVEIDWEFTNESEFLHLAQLKALLDTRNIKAYLTLKYLPYARQDKPITNDSTFALTVFSHLLNSLQFEHVAINDPHSDIALKLIYNSHAYYPLETIHNVGFETKTNLVCYPDKGALEKYSKVYPFQYIYGEKVRDQSTGNITSYKLLGSPKNHNILIVDDICDYGNTFIKLTTELLKDGGAEVNLFVTHGLFSGGLKPLKNAGINRIFTSDGEISEFNNSIVIKKMING